MMNNRIFALLMILLFGTMAIICLVGAIWNPWQLFLGAMCIGMVAVGIYEFRKKY